MHTHTPPAPVSIFAATCSASTQVKCSCWSGVGTVSLPVVALLSWSILSNTASHSAAVCKHSLSSDCSLLRLSRVTLSNPAVFLCFIFFMVVGVTFGTSTGGSCKGDNSNELPHVHLKTRLRVLHDVSIIAHHFPVSSCRASWRNSTSPPTTSTDVRPSWRSVTQYTHTHSSCVCRC